MHLFLAILALLLLLIATILLALLYFGLFDEIEVKSGAPPFQFGGRQIAYKKRRGKYSEANTLFTEVCSLVPHLRTIGIYYDDPDIVADINKCRYAVGVLLDSDGQTQSDADKQLLTSNGFECASLPIVDHVVNATFQFKGIISVVIAIRRVYPKIKAYVTEHKLCAHPGIEVYADSKIYFMFPLAKQDQFYHLYGEEYDIDESEDSSDEQNADLAQRNANSNGAVEESKSSKSSTSSSFEELHAEENGKEV